MRERIVARGRERDAWKLANWPQHIASIDFGFTPAAPVYLIENSRGAPSLANQAADLIARLLPSAG